MSIAETLESPVAVTIPQALDQSDVARHFGVSLITISRWVKAGQLPAPIKIGSRKYWTAEMIAKLLVEADSVSADKGR